MDIVCVYSECEVIDRSSNNKPELRQARILAELQKHKNVRLVKNEDLPSETQLETVHDLPYLNFLRDAYTSWRDADDSDWFRDGGVVPNHIPYGRRGISGGIIPVYKLSGVHCTDTMSPISEDTNKNARLSAMNSLRCADEMLGGAKITYALNGSPGHHAMKDRCGGYCFLNNAALAAQHLQMKTGQKIAMLDLDYHHGNGQQDIFYDDPDIVTVSLHINPQFDYPSFTGFADELGENAGKGFNKNVPLPPDTEDLDYVIALADALKYIKDQKCGSIVVPFGGDTFNNDPDKSNIAGFALSEEVYSVMGRMVGSLHLPMVITQEGGYSLKHIPDIVYDFLEGCSQQKPQE